MKNENPLPWGLPDLDPQPQWSDNKDRIKCFIRDCDHYLIPPTRKLNSGEACPVHQIFCHRSKTYRYTTPALNIIASRHYYTEKIDGHAYKFESHRLGMERSEDALSWNVFKSLQNAGRLASLVNMMVGENHADEPILFLWGINVGSAGADIWHLLEDARERFESRLPVRRPKTEPDISLWLPGEYLIHIEAKFTSGNGIYQRGPRRSVQDLTFDELLNIYWDESTRILNRSNALEAGRVHYQLWRNTLFAEWMAERDDPTTRAYHINLVRAGSEEAAAVEFQQLIQPAFADRFHQITWEQIYNFASQRRDELNHLCTYFEQKTEQLKPAFRINRL